jgi:hypothetical protein
MDFDAKKNLLQEVSDYVHSYLRFNDCEVPVDVTVPVDMPSDQVRFARIELPGYYSVDRDDLVLIDLHAMQQMPQAERRMYVWGIIARMDVVTILKQEAHQRLEAANTEYEEILVSQDLLK